MIPAAVLLLTPKPLSPLGAYPRVRMRRNRRAEWSRRLVAEHVLTPADFIWPVFIAEGSSGREAIDSMPGAWRLTIPALVEEAGRAVELGIPVVAVFPVVPSHLRSAEGEEALNPGKSRLPRHRRLEEGAPGARRTL